jgi:hypothetical protein
MIPSAYLLWDGGRSLIGWVGLLLSWICILTSRVLGIRQEAKAEQRASTGLEKRPDDPPQLGESQNGGE